MLRPWSRVREETQHETQPLLREGRPHRHEDDMAKALEQAQHRGALLLRHPCSTGEAGVDAPSNPPSRPGHDPDDQSEPERRRHAEPHRSE